MRSSSGCSRSAVRTGHEWKPRQPEVDRPQEVGQIGDDEGARRRPVRRATRWWSCSQSGRCSGTRFWKNDEPPAPFGNRCSSTGPVADRAHQRLFDGEVEVDEVKLGVAPVAEEDLVRARDGDLVARHGEHDGIGRHAATVVASPAAAVVLGTRTWTLTAPKPVLPFAHGGQRGGGFDDGVAPQLPGAGPTSADPVVVGTGPAGGTHRRPGGGVRPRGGVRGRSAVHTPYSHLVTGWARCASPERHCAAMPARCCAAASCRAGRRPRRPPRRARPGGIANGTGNSRSTGAPRWRPTSKPVMP